MKMFSLESHILSIFPILDGPIIAVLHTMIHVSVISILNEAIILIRSWFSKSSCFSYYNCTFNWKRR
jgi:hypothetical protein